MQPNEIPDELIDQLLAGREGPEAITGPDGLLKHLTKRVVERAASAELTEHLGYELAGEPPEGQSNRRNGSAAKTLITDHGPVEVELPRDREAWVGVYHGIATVVSLVTDDSGSAILDGHSRARWATS